MNIVITGSRSLGTEVDPKTHQLTDRARLQRRWITRVLDDYWDDDWIEVPTMVNGGAQGVDMICYDWANAQKTIDIILMQAEWAKYGKSAGFKRNLEMLAVGDYCLAFWDGKSRGTRHTIDHALNKGMSTHVHVWRDS